MRPSAAALLALLLCARLFAQAGSVPDPQRTRDSYLAEGARELQARREAQAVDAYRHAIALDPASADAYAGLGLAYYRLGRLPDAVAAYDSAVRLSPAAVATRINRAIAVHALGRTADARADIMEARRLARGNAGALNQVAIVLENVFSAPDEALAAYREASDADPTNATVFHNIGLLEVKRGQYANAVAAFAAAVGLDPAMRNAWFFLAESHSRLQQYEEAIAAWTKFLVLVPDGPDATQNRAWDYLCWGGHGAEAAADGTRFLTVVGWNDGASPYMMLVAYFGEREAGRADEARLLLDEAAVKLPARAWPYPIIRYLRGDMPEAALLESADSNDRKTEAHAYIGMSLLAGGDSSAARSHLAWVTTYGNRRFREFALATRALAGM